MRNLLFAAASIFIFNESCLAGAWTLPKGESQIIVTAALTNAADAFDENGDVVAVEEFEKYALRAYAEYGVTDWATIVLQPEIRSKEQGDEESFGVGRFDLGLRTRVWRDDFAVASLEFSASAPGQNDELAPLNGGDTDWEFEARALYGRGFDLGWRHGFADLQIGYKHRVSEPADEVSFDVTLGLDVTERSFAMLQSFNRLSVGSAKAPFARTQENALSFSGVHKITDRWSIQSGISATAYGRNVLRERGVFLALWSKF
jgi:hypothetical protein